MDDAKSERCVRERGFGFDDILLAFLDPARQIEQDSRHAYGNTVDPG
jgi:uncharacterized DUF497 family protein